MIKFQFLRIVRSSISTILIQAVLITSFCGLLSEQSGTESGENSVNYAQHSKSFLTNSSSLGGEERINNTTKKLVCFYVFTKDFSPEIMDRMCTHIIVGFFGINKENSTLEVSNEQEEVLSKVISLKESTKDLKVLIAVGGAGNWGFSFMVTNHTMRKMFIRSCMEVIKKYKIDGIDLDWEWPVVIDGNKKEKVKFIQLLYEIREEFNRHKKKYILSADVSALPPLIELAYYVNYIADYVDFVNIMCYDYNYYSKLHPFTGHNAPLYSTDNFLRKSINDSVSFWILNSMPREKIVVGVPTYGHTFQLVSSNHHSLVAPSKGYGSIGQNGFAVYHDICEFLKRKDTVIVYDDSCKVPYAYQFPEWISYDDEESLTVKANYILKENLGGAMVFSVNADDFTGKCKGDGVPLPLIRKIRNILLNEV